MAGESILNPVNSKNIELSKSLRDSLAASGYSFTTMDEVVTELIKVTALTKKMEDLEAKFSLLSSGNMPSGARSYGLSGGSVDAVKIVNRRVDWSLGEDGLTYSFENLKKDLPADMTLVSATATVVGANGDRTGNKGTKAVISLPENAQTAHLQANIKTKKGTIVLTTEVQLTGPVKTGAPLMRLDEFSAAESDMTIQKHLDVLSAELALVKQQL